MSYIIFFFARLINSLIPKSKNKIIFISRPDFTDNTLHMYRYIKKNYPKKELSWLIYDKNIYQLLLKKDFNDIYYLKSIKGLLEYARSKIIITSSSSLWQIKSPFQKQYDLWHGIPLKNLLCMGEEEIAFGRQAKSITKRFATSTLNKAQLAASFDFNALNIEITGQSRTDALFTTDKNISKLLNIDTTSYNKIVFYMPTYRHGFKEKKDGVQFNSNNIFRMQQYNHSMFIQFLEKKNILFLIKLHPYEEKLYTDIDLGKNIHWITNISLIKKNLDTYDLLHEIDTLITDYSSIYFDFLLLDKKIIFAPSDLATYTKQRGFQLEPYHFWTPGQKVFTQNALQESLIEEDTDDERNHRHKIRDIMFKYQDNFSSKRIYETIMKDFT